MRLDQYLPGSVGALRSQEEYEQSLAKNLSPRGSRSSRNRARLTAKLKARRRYPKPVRGGTGKQARTRRNRFHH